LYAQYLLVAALAALQTAGCATVACSLVQAAASVTPLFAAVQLNSCSTNKPFDLGIAFCALLLNARTHDACLTTNPLCVHMWKT
jgi:hypothetical protein